MVVFSFLCRITEGPFDPEIIQSEYSIQDEEIKVSIVTVTVTSPDLVESFFVYDTC